MVRCVLPRLTVNGLVDPVGVDPDDCSFAWTLQASGRAVMQTAFRIVVRRTDPGQPGLAWDSGNGGCPLARPSSPTGGRPGRRRGLRVDGAGAGAAGEVGAGLGSGPLHDRAAGGGLAGPVAAAGRRVAATRPRHLPARRGHAAAAGTLHRATAYVSAAHTYRLYVDGVPVDAWPSFSYPDEQYARAVDLTGALAGAGPAPSACCTAGTGRARAGRRRRPGLLFQLSLQYDDGRSDVVVSDASWRERPAEWLPSPQRNSDGGDFVEWVDGRDHPQGWSSPGYDDGTWSSVTVVGPAGSAPFLRTYAQRTTIRESPVLPVSLHTVAGGAMVADFGAVYPARPQIQFGQGQPGNTISMRAGYLLDPDGQVSTLHGTQETNLSFSYIMGPGDHQAFEAFTYFGYRYVQIDNPGQSLRRDQIVASPGAPPCPTSRRRRSPRTTGCSMPCGGSWRVPACTAARSSSSTPRPGRRASSSGTRRTSPRRSCASTVTRT